jgi:hypothetical protein
MRDFDTIEVRPCCVVDRYGVETVEQCGPEDANRWSVYGRRRVTKEFDCLEDFPTEAEAEDYAKKLLHTHRHLFRIVKFPIVQRWLDPQEFPALFKRPARTRGGSSDRKPPRTKRT